MNFFFIFCLDFLCFTLYPPGNVAFFLLLLLLSVCLFVFSHILSEAFSEHGILPLIYCFVFLRKLIIAVIL